MAVNAIFKTNNLASIQSERNLYSDLIKEAIQIEIFEQREQKEKQELEAYSKKYSQEPLVLTKDMEVK